MIVPTIDQLLAGIPRSLGSYAPVINEIEAALESPQCSLVTVGEAIEKDPDLTARLLRLANSSFYGFSSRLSTVTEAVSLIGIQQVQDLIVASSSIERFSGISEEFVSMESFWRHSLACGIAARLLALEKRLPKPDKLFVVGLLHDVGRLVLFSQSPAGTQEIFKLYHSEKLLLRDAEQRVLGYDHQQIAGALLTQWKYPVGLVQAVACHHSPAGSDLAPMETAVVHISDHLVNAMQLGSSGERFIPPLNAKAWNRLGLATDSLGTLMNTIEEQLDAIQEVFLSRH
jgi:HD-like signal output (HDOD) protein